MKDNKHRYTERPIKCAAPECKKDASIFYKNIGLCKTHGEDWSNVEKYVNDYKEKKQKEWRKRKTQTPDKS